MNKRGSGVLLHISSLPSGHGIGDFGPGAYRFADFLNETKQKYWQLLPLNPTNPIYGSSPYSSNSSFAGNILFISPELLYEDGLLLSKDIKHNNEFKEHSCDYERVASYKEKLFSKAFENFKKQEKYNDEFREFCFKNSHWLDNYAIFIVLKNNHKQESWDNWHQELRDKNQHKIDSLIKKHQDEVEKEKFSQFVFFKQWFALKSYCNQKGIKLIGDLPIYVNYDSADVWSNVDIFKLDENKRPSSVAGVPPDYFSKTGQLWGNPVYNWDVLRQSNFGWWIMRMQHVFDLFDIVRIDHFRGLVAYWEVPSGEKTAMHGKWVGVPCYDFFNELLRSFNSDRIIAEDLGIITDDVREVMGRYNFSGMKILLFAFDNDDPMHPYLPHSFDRNFVVYTGTHDNNTLRGWFEKEAGPESKKRLFNYIGRKLTTGELNWEIIRLLMMSVAKMSIFPLQDIIGLGDQARMNKPSTTKGNWQWRFSWDQITDDMHSRLSGMTQVYGRV